MQDIREQIHEPIPKKRLLVGGLLFVVGQLAFLFIPLFAMADMPTQWKAILIGVILFAIPEVSLLAAVAILGKPGFTYLKRQMLLAFKRHVLPEAVSPTRYHIGIVLFVTPLIAGWVLPYIGDLIPLYTDHRALVGAVGDLMLLSSLLVLGGEFWDKLRALFVHSAKMQLPGSSPGHRS